jgi:hypothetical protein
MITEVDITHFERVGARGCSEVQVLTFGNSLAIAEIS